jgi:hypothetical protein
MVSVNYANGHVVILRKVRTDDGAAQRHQRSVRTITEE